MAPGIPTREPAEFTAGDTVKWTVSFGDFPADDGWTLEYTFRGPEVHDVSATADGAAHAIVIATTVSSKFAPGHYWWDAYATKGAERFRARSGELDVLRDLKAVDDVYDDRTHVKTVLDALEAVFERKATQDQSSYSIEGRSLSRMAPDELIRWISLYRSLYRQEQNAARIKQGLSTKNIVRTRFQRPT